MMENNHDESSLEQRLRKHYQQRYQPPQAPSAVWARVQPALDQQEKSAPNLVQRAKWRPALTGFLVAMRQGAFTQKREKDTLTENATPIKPAERDHPQRLRNKQPLNRRLRHTLEAALAVLLVGSLVLGWFAVTKWRSAQGSGPVLYTYASQLGEVEYDAHWTLDGKHLIFAIYTIAKNHYRYLVWDAATGKARQTLDISLPAGLIGRVILDSSDGRYALIRTNGSSPQNWELKLADILTGQTRLIYQATYQGLHASDVPAVAFSEDSKYVAFIGADERIGIWSMAAGKMLQTTDALTAPEKDGGQWLTWSLDDKRIMAKSAQINSGQPGQPGRLQVWSVQTGHKLLNIVETPTMSLFNWASEFGNLAGLSLDGTRILTYNEQTGVMVERESNTLKVLHTFSIRVTSPGVSIANGAPLWVANGTRFFFQQRQAVSIWDGNTGKLISSISLKDDPEQGVSVFPSIEGGRFIALQKQGNLVEIWDIVTGAKVRTIAPTITLQGEASWSPDGKYLDLNDANGNGQIYNALNGRFVMNYHGEWALLSPDSQHIATRTSLSGFQTDNSLTQTMMQVVTVP
jgi:WD40 repeat protein